MKRQLTEWEKIFVNHTSDKELISKIHKELIQLNSKKIKQSDFKNGQMWINVFQRRHTDGHCRYIKICSTSLLTREMQIETTMSYHLTLFRMAIIKKTRNNKCWRGYGEKETLVLCWWECKLVQPLWKREWKLLKKLKIELAYDPQIPCLSIYPKKMKTQIQKDICSPMFITALFTIAKTWKQPKCPLMGKWIKKLWYVCATYIQWNIIEP